MSHFQCSECGTLIFDSPTGYKTGCKHWPIEGQRSGDKLTHYDAELMRALRKERKPNGKKFTYREIGEKFEVTAAYARQICIGQYMKPLQDEA